MLWWFCYVGLVVWVSFFALRILVFVGLFGLCFDFGFDCFVCCVLICWLALLTAVFGLSV